MKFVSAEDVLSHAAVDARYYSENNFTGRRVAGYMANKALLSEPLAEALIKAEILFYDCGYSMLIYDAYRPKKAVEDFFNWALDLSDIKTKRFYYPDILKEQILERGYLLKNSKHTTGSAVDLTLRCLRTGREVDMGGTFDFFGEISASDFNGLSLLAKSNRRMLRGVMEKCSLMPVKSEWWHFNLAIPLQEEFDFDIE